MYFASENLPRNMILNDAIAIASSAMPHDFVKDGPHTVAGPVAVQGAEPGDVLKGELLSIVPRVPYDAVANRRGNGALPGEFPEKPQPSPNASPAQPDLYRNVSVFTPIRRSADGGREGIMNARNGREVRFPTAPFMGVTGVAPNTTDMVYSIPPGLYGGNIDINDLGIGSTVYLPVFVMGADFHTGDPHMAQGDGEVALTALEHSLRPTTGYRRSWTGPRACTA